MPKEQLLAGKVVVAQVTHFKNNRKRLLIAKKFIEGAAFNMRKNLRYYNKRGKDLANELAIMDTYMTQIEEVRSVGALMGVEGNVRQIYYQGFDVILNDWQMNGRSKRPPKNEVNALISFGNMMCYATCLDELYHTQLNPTVSFLHEPGYRPVFFGVGFGRDFQARVGG